MTTFKHCSGIRAKQAARIGKRMRAAGTDPVCATYLAPARGHGFSIAFTKTASTSRIAWRNSSPSN
ncbi:MAG: hypothetical protein EOP39_02245 [Rubrivivax sp.]|nr:MAG: hypothetical protein EOP39_02245 [Rubrivivax sp.]